MDYDKLINDLRWWAAYCGQPNHGCLTTRCILDDAATAIETLRAENDKLRAELEQVKAERDAAVSDLERIKSCKVCKYCDSLKTLIPIVCQKCHHGDNWKWRGIRED